jgi:hypothetical protein
MITRSCRARRAALARRREATVSEQMFQLLEALERARSADETARARKEELVSQIISISRCFAKRDLRMMSIDHLEDIVKTLLNDLPLGESESIPTGHVYAVRVA